MDILGLLNSNFIVGLFTLLTGTIAILIYFSQKWDLKKNAAKTLYLEIVYSERIINELKELKARNSIIGMDTNKFFLTTSTWNTSKYLFINDLNSAEWDKLNDFYNQYEALSNTLKDIKSVLYQNIIPRTQTVQQKLGEIAHEYTEKIYQIETKANLSPIAKNKEIEKAGLEYSRKAELFKQSYIDNSIFQYQYTPSGFYQFMDTGLDLINTTISTSTIGQKLKKIASIS